MKQSDILERIDQNQYRGLDSSATGSRPFPLAGPQSSYPSSELQNIYQGNLFFIQNLRQNLSIYNSSELCCSMLTILELK